MANEIRKTSLGMQAVGAGPLRPYESISDLRSDRRAHVWGLTTTIALHVGIGVRVAVMTYVERTRTTRHEEPFQAIEAGLAFRKKAAPGPKSKLPQQDVQQKVAPPDAPKISKNPDAVPTQKDEKKEIPPPEAVDSKSVFNKYRRMDTGTTAGDKSTEEKNQVGADDGSEFGTLDKAKGDPYIGELIGRMVTDFVVPSVVSDQTLSTWGCVKLDADGKIVDRALDPEHKSRSHAFNSAVEERLKRTTDMDKPVPNYLKAMLVGKFVCATYTSKLE